MNFSTFSLFQAFMTRLSHGKTTQTKQQQKKALQIVPSSSKMSETWSTMSSTVASLMFAWAIICQYSPYEVRTIIDRLKLALNDYFNPNLQISIHETIAGERMRRSEAFSLVEAYLTSVASNDAKRLRADMENEASDLVLSLDDQQDVYDDYGGARLWWGMRRIPPSQKVPYYEQGRRFYVLEFHRRHRDTVTKSYLDHVMRTGREIRSSSRQRRLYTNVAGGSRTGGSPWSHVAFEHPARLETMALEPEKKAEIFEDLVAFSRNREFYKRAGRAWKRGYLLHGPPGTGKSTMVAAMANLLNYDLYDLELTVVKDNTELRRLLIETTSKSVIVIEDIDCSLDLTGQRMNKSSTSSDTDKKMKKGKEEEVGSRVTLSGLLNFIDGVWSACGAERLIVFTTNHVEKLDPALIRSGRMDKHIELSYCSFRGFRVLAKNYLGVDDHEMFGDIERLIGEVDITPADVAERLVPKSTRDGPEKCLSNLVRALEEAKEAKANAKLEEAEILL